MKSNYLLPSLAVLGFAVTIAAVVLGNPWQPSAPATPMPQPRIPYAAYVAGAGVIEARLENIPIGTPVAGIVTAIDVRWGDRVQVGDRLFEIDDRALQAQLLPATAKVREAEAQWAQATRQLALAQSVPDPRAVSGEDMSRRRGNAAVAKAALDSARADLERIRKELDLHSVHALAAGTVLQINIHPGEYASSGMPLMLLGDNTRLHVRANIDQNDAWRVHAGSAATAFVRGNPNIVIPLRFERIEPTVIPRAVVTGDSTERVDTRVLQVIYSFDPAKLPVYVGQLVDVYIEAPPEQSGGKATPRS
ncbi:efflux RND transporter periplasmic adaptor subunit [Dyella flagellata]|uniref:Glycosyl hydrolase family 18 n=1 Tax=Dyella flagellata TaxID=1867833 RepID=A0ABQ5X9Q9_9GAMM|nr:efflux RND transporter periplasmic adaptor subunit [Dyella flagellata]GLQ87381.1 glycosyl hydrolase family 18 [Dyella flagellata]